MPHPLVTAVQPVASRIGATVVPVEQGGTDDIPLVWEDAVVGYLRLPVYTLGDALGQVLADVATQFDRPLPQLSTADRRRAVLLLEERGAFTMRRSVQQVATAFGVSRFTVYNYLHAAGH